MPKAASTIHETDRRVSHDTQDLLNSNSLDETSNLEPLISVTPSISNPVPCSTHENSNSITRLQPATSGDAAPPDTRLSSSSSESPIRDVKRVRTGSGDLSGSAASTNESSSIPSFQTRSKSYSGTSSPETAKPPHNKHQQDYVYVSHNAQHFNITGGASVSSRIERSVNNSFPSKVSNGTLNSASVAPSATSKAVSKFSWVKRLVTRGGSRTVGHGGSAGGSNTSKITGSETHLTPGPPKANASSAVLSEGSKKGKTPKVSSGKKAAHRSLRLNVLPEYIPSQSNRDRHINPSPNTGNRSNRSSRHSHHSGTSRSHGRNHSTLDRYPQEHGSSSIPYRVPHSTRGTTYAIFDNQGGLLSPPPDHASDSEKYHDHNYDQDNTDSQNHRYYGFQTSEEYYSAISETDDMSRHPYGPAHRAMPLNRAQNHTHNVLNPPMSPLSSVTSISTVSSTSTVSHAVPVYYTENYVQEAVEEATDGDTSNDTSRNNSGVGPGVNFTTRTLNSSTFDDTLFPSALERRLRNRGPDTISTRGTYEGHEGNSPDTYFGVGDDDTSSDASDDQGSDSTENDECGGSRITSEHNGMILDQNAQNHGNSHARPNNNTHKNSQINANGSNTRGSSSRLTEHRRRSHLSSTARSISRSSSSASSSSAWSSPISLYANPVSNSRQQSRATSNPASIHSSSNAAGITRTGSSNSSRPESRNTNGLLLSPQSPSQSPLFLSQQSQPFNVHHMSHLPLHSGHSGSNQQDNSSINSAFRLSTTSNNAHPHGHSPSAGTSTPIFGAGGLFNLNGGGIFGFGSSSNGNAVAGNLSGAGLSTLSNFQQHAHDTASIITLASSSRHRQRRSFDTNASTRAIAPESIKSRHSFESLPHTLTSAATVMSYATSASATSAGNTSSHAGLSSVISNDSDYSSNSSSSSSIFIPNPNGNVFNGISITLSNTQPSEDGVASSSASTAAVYSQSARASARSSVATFDRLEKDPDVTSARSIKSIRFADDIIDDTVSRRNIDENFGAERSESSNEDEARGLGSYNNFKPPDETLHGPSSGGGLITANNGGGENDGSSSDSDTDDEDQNGAEHHNVTDDDMASIYAAPIRKPEPCDSTSGRPDDSRSVEFPDESNDSVSATDDPMKFPNFVKSRPSSSLFVDRGINSSHSRTASHDSRESTEEEITSSPQHSIHSRPSSLIPVISGTPNNLFSPVSTVDSPVGSVTGSILGSVAVPTSNQPQGTYGSRSIYSNRSTRSAISATSSMYSYEIDSDLDISGMDMDMDMDECYYYFDGYDDEDCSDDEISRGNSFNYEDTAGEDRSNLNRYIIPTVVKSQQRRLRAHKRHSRDEPTLEGEDNEYFYATYCSDSESLKGSPYWAYQHGSSATSSHAVTPINSQMGTDGLTNVKHNPKKSKQQRDKGKGKKNSSSTSRSSSVIKQQSQISKELIREAEAPHADNASMVVLRNQDDRHRHRRRRYWDDRAQRGALRRQRRRRHFMLYSPSTNTSLVSGNDNASSSVVSELTHNSLSTMASNTNSSMVGIKGDSRAGSIKSESTTAILKLAECDDMGMAGLGLEVKEKEGPQRVKLLESEGINLV